MNVSEHTGETLQYLAVEPDGYGGDTRYPMIVLLHGFGANMRDLAGLCSAIGPEGYVYIFPNGPLTVQLGPGMTGYAWTPPGEGSTSEDGERAQEMLEGLFVEVIDRYAVEPGQVLMGGFSQGGMMTYRLGLPKPDIFGGLAVLSSRIADTEELRPRLPASRDQSIFISHGTRDTIIPLEDARESKRFLESEGYRPQYTEYDMAHEISQDVMGDLVPWIHRVLPPAQ